MSIFEFIRARGFDFEPELTSQYKTETAGSRKVWYIGDTHKVGDKEIIVLTFGDWKSGEKHVYKSDTSNLSKKELKDIETKIREQSEKANEAKRLSQEAVAANASKKVSQLKSADPKFPYLKKKGLSSSFGALEEHNFLRGTKQLVIPTRDIDGKIWGFQSITPSGDKFFVSEQRTKECFFQIGEIESKSHVYFCEGFATGASIHLAIQKPTVVCFNASNLVAVVRAFRERYPHISIVVCGDNDRFLSENVGEKKALEAARLSWGVSVIPFFSDDSKKPTDFNDLHTLEGIEEVEHQLRSVKPKSPPKLYVHGMRGKNIYLSSSDNPEIMALSELNRVELTKLLPTRYWASKYGTASEKSDEPNWAKVHDSLWEDARMKPQFSLKKERGKGVWLEGKNLVIHLGDRVIYKGKEIHVRDVPSQFDYAYLDPSPKLAGSGLTREEEKASIEIIKRLGYKDPSHYMALSGFLFVAPLAGALEWRPHIWLTGARGTGKSTVLEEICKRALLSSDPIIAQGASEAGIRQSIRSNAAVVMLDEFQDMSESAMKQIMHLARSASSAAGGVLRGSAGGVATEFNARFCALFSSVNVAQLQAQDDSRICKIELVSNKKENWESFQSEIARVFTDSFSKRFFRHTIDRYQTFKDSYKTLYQILSEKKDPRYGQQIGTLLAGHWAWQNEKPISNEEALALCETWFKGLSGFGAEDESDEEDCLMHLLSANIRTLEGQRTVHQVISKIDSPSEEDEFAMVLAAHGLKYYPDEKKLFVSSRNAELARIFDKTPWKDWRRTLSRLGGEEMTARLNGSRPRGIKIKIDVDPEPSEF